MALTAEVLRSVLDYDPETGVFRWKVRSDVPESVNSRWAGKVAGSLDSSGYTTIRVMYRRHRANRLAWLYVHGRWPDRLIDHIDGDVTNDRIANLREASHSENLANSRTRDATISGHKGVTWCPRSGKWYARVAANGSRKFLGRFAEKDVAIAEYTKALRIAFGEFARVE